MPKPRSLPSSAEYHTEAEVIAALEALTDTEIRYLVGFARCRILGADPDDLCSDAIIQTLKLRRKWRRGVSMRNHLIACMRSIASSRFKRAIRHCELAPDQPAPFSAPELSLDARADVKWLTEVLLRKRDAVALAVLDTLSDGLKQKQAVEHLQMRHEVYEAARRRIRRLAEKLFRTPRETPHA
jgi:DNA-directed RNA polymerase specialized sigma24 family protein